MSAFIPGLDLCESFYRNAAKPIIQTHFPQLRYSAALIGWGSEVLGYDDLTSTDHNWGPRFLLFLSKQDHGMFAGKVSQTLSESLPQEFRGYPTHFGLSVQGDQRAMQKTVSGPVAHMIEIYSVEDYFEQYLGYVPDTNIGVIDWLCFSQHKLLSLTSGKVFEDGLGSLEPLRQKFNYYPHDVWLYILAAQWAKIAEEELFVGRCGEVGDELGSLIVAARQVKNLMRLCFLLEKKYAPYSKWFGTAFSRLNCGGELGPILKHVLLSDSRKEREKHLGDAYERVARMHNNLQITEPLNARVEPHGRPYLVIRADRFATETRNAIQCEQLKNIRLPIGSVDQVVDSDQQLSSPALCKSLMGLYDRN